MILILFYDQSGSEFIWVDPVQLSYLPLLPSLLSLFWILLLDGMEKLRAKTQECRMTVQIRSKKWKWMGHSLRKPHNNITKWALLWNPQGKRNRKRPKNNWRRTRTVANRSAMDPNWTPSSGQTIVEEYWKCAMLHIGAKAIYICGETKTWVEMECAQK